MFEHSSERADVIEKLAIDFGFADAICRLHYAAGEMPPSFCYSEFNRIWCAMADAKFTWLERQVIYGRIEIVT